MDFVQHLHVEHEQGNQMLKITLRGSDRVLFEPERACLAYLKASHQGKILRGQRVWGTCSNWSPATQPFTSSLESWEPPSRTALHTLPGRLLPCTDGLTTLLPLQGTHGSTQEQLHVIAHISSSRDLSHTG